MKEPETDTFKIMWQQRTYALEAELHEAHVENTKLRAALEWALDRLASEFVLTGGGREGPRRPTEG